MRTISRSTIDSIVEKFRKNQIYVITVTSFCSVGRAINPDQPRVAQKCRPRDDRSIGKFYESGSRELRERILSSQIIEARRAAKFPRREKRSVTAASCCGTINSRHSSCFGNCRSEMPENSADTRWRTGESAGKNSQREPSNRSEVFLSSREKCMFVGFAKKKKKQKTSFARSDRRQSVVANEYPCSKHRYRRDVSSRARTYFAEKARVSRLTVRFNPVSRIKTSCRLPSFREPRHRGFQSGHSRFRFEAFLPTGSTAECRYCRDQIVHDRDFSRDIAR